MSTELVVLLAVGTHGLNVAMTLYGEISKPVSPYLLKRVVAIITEFIERQDEQYISDGRLESAIDANGGISHFHGKTISDCSIHKYVDRLVRYYLLESELILMLIYLARLSQMKVPLLTSYSIHRAIAACTLVSAKMSKDTHYLRQSKFTKLCGLQSNEVFYIEQELLHLVQFKLHVSREEYMNTMDAIDTYTCLDRLPV